MARAQDVTTWPNVLALRFWPESASASAHNTDMIYCALLGLAGFFALLICTLIVFFAVKYRAGVETDRSISIHGTTAAEITWITIPFVMMFCIFVWAAASYAHARIAPINAQPVYVVGKQWMWKIEHVQGKSEINELHVPAGVPIKLVMISQDVIHSFYVPAFRVKQDVLPGRYTTMWFEANKPGVYHLYCAEYCGSEHSRMRGRVVVMQPPDFEAWLDREHPVEGPVPGPSGFSTEPSVARHAGPFFEFGCNACHWPGTAVQAPSLAGLYGSKVKLANGDTVIADEQYLRESFFEPSAKIVAGYPAPSVMPTYRGQMSERDVIRLIEFIKSLQNGWPEEPSP